MPTPRSRLLLLSGGPIVRASDAFTAADGTAITALSPAWTKDVAASSNTAAPVVDAGRVHNENAATVSVYYRDDWVPASPNYRVEADVVAVSSLNGAGVAGRISGSTFYFAQYTNGSGWRLFRVVSGTITQIGSTIAQSLTLGQPYRLALDMAGSLISLAVDGAVVTSATDSNITAAGRAGIRLQAAATSTTGIHLDNWRAVQ